MRVRLFGLIAEKAGTRELVVEAPSTADLRRVLEERIQGLSGLSYALAVDRRIVLQDRSLSGSEEIALLPPFAGG